MAKPSRAADLLGLVDLLWELALLQKTALEHYRVEWNRWGFRHGAKV
jgi:hypothetical protein